MFNQHGEIPCVHPRVERHGGRRRRCVLCGATWSVHQRRRGRKKRPRRLKSLVPTFVGKLTLRQRAHLKGRKSGTVSKRHRATLDVLGKVPWPVTIPQGPLLLIIDGLWFEIGNTRWVVYLMALRKTDADEAVFLRPILQPGAESQKQWRATLQIIPADVQHRICALISDSFRGVKELCNEHGWLLQRCHAHLLRRIADVFGTKKQTLRWKKGRQQAEGLIRTLITIEDAGRVLILIQKLHRLSEDPSCPRKVCMIIREVIRHHETFRTYLSHPELNLPITTNTIESLNSRLRELAGRSRGFRSPKSLERWIVAYLWFHPTSKCRPKNPQN